MDLSTPPPVLADLYFAKIWLARRFTAPGCEPVCCDGNSPMPFARGAFRYAMCSDAFMYIWTKRQFVLDMLRLIDSGDAGNHNAAGAAIISHTHNQCTWTPSHGQPLTPEGYRHLFETLEPRLFGESGLFADVVKGGPLESRAAGRSTDTRSRSSADDYRQPAHGRFRAAPARARRRLERAASFASTRCTSAGAAGAAGSASGDTVRFRLQFPSEDYEQEYGACRQYLPDEVTISRRALQALDDGRLPDELADLVRRRVIVDLPGQYY